MSTCHTCVFFIFEASAMGGGNNSDCSSRLFYFSYSLNDTGRVRGPEGDSGSLHLWILTAGYLWAALSPCAYGVITSRVKYFNCQWLWLISLSTLTSALWDVLPETSSCGMSLGIFGMPRGSQGTTHLVWGKKAGCLRFKFHIHPRHWEPRQPRNGC